MKLLKLLFITHVLHHVSSLRVSSRSMNQSQTLQDNYVKDQIVSNSGAANLDFNVKESSLNNEILNFTELENKEVYSYYGRPHLTPQRLELTMKDPLASAPKIEALLPLTAFPKITKFLHKKLKCNRTISKWVYRKIIVNCECIKDSEGNIVMDFVEPQFQEICSCYCGVFKNFSEVLRKENTSCDVCKKLKVKQEILDMLFQKKVSLENAMINKQLGLVTINGYSSEELLYDFANSDLERNFVRDPYNDGLSEVLDLTEKSREYGLISNTESPYDVYHPIFGSKADPKIKEGIIYNFNKMALPPSLHPDLEEKEPEDKPLDNVVMIKSALQGPEEGAKITKVQLDQKTLRRLDKTAGAEPDWQ